MSTFLFYFLIFSTIWFSDKLIMFVYNLYKNRKTKEEVTEEVIEESETVSKPLNYTRLLKKVNKDIGKQIIVEDDEGNDIFVKIESIERVEEKDAYLINDKYEMSRQAFILNTKDIRGSRW